MHNLKSENRDPRYGVFTPYPHYPFEFTLTLGLFMGNISMIQENQFAPDPTALSADPGRLASEFKRCIEWVRLATANARKNLECVAKHQEELRAQNETELRLKSFSQWRESGVFTESEKAALNLSEAISLQEPEVISKIIHQDLRHHFNEEEIVHLTLTSIAVNDWIELHAPPIRILVVEDNADDQELLRRQLVKARMDENVLFVSDGLQAMELVERFSGSNSALIAIFLDLHLPNLNGLQILQRLRSLPRMESFPVFVMTSSIDPRDLEECQRLKVSSYVPKPITYDSFSHAVANVFHSNQSTRSAA